MEHKDTTRRVIGCAFRVYNTLGFGFLESVYEKSLLIELAKTRIHAESQSPVSVHYDGQEVGAFFVDILVEREIIIELKSVRQLVPDHEVQLVNYLTATKLDIGLLLNFGPSKVEVKRRTRTLPTSQGDEIQEE